MRILLQTLIWVYSASLYASWSEEVVQNNTDFKLYSDGAVTANDVPHVFYQGRYLYHSYLDIDKWVTEKVDDRLSFTGSSTEGVAVATGPSGKIHLIYSSRADRLKYAVGTTGDWTIIDTPLVVADSSGGHVGDLVVDSEGKLHVFYIEGAFDQFQTYVDHLVHAVYDGVSWVRENIDDLGRYSCGGDCKKITAEIESNDRIHLIYNAGSGANEQLRYRTSLGGVWSGGVLATTADNNLWEEHSTLVLDDSDNPMICYWTSTNKQICVNKLSGTWSASEVVVNGSTLTNCTLQLTLARDVNGLIQGVRTCLDGMEFIEYDNGTWTARENVQYDVTNKPYVLATAADATYVFNLKNFGTDASLMVYSLDAGVTAKGDVTKISAGAAGKYPNVEFGKNDSLYLTYDWRVYSENSTGDWVSTFLQYGNNDTPKFPVAIKSDDSKHFFYNNSTYNNKYIMLDYTGETSVDNYLPDPVKSNIPPVSYVDKDDYIHLMYVDVNTRVLYYTTNRSGSWVVKGVYTLPSTAIENQALASILYPYSLDFNQDQNGNFVAALIEPHYDPYANYSYSANLIKVYSSGNIWYSEIVTENEGVDLSANLWKDPVVKVDKVGNIHLAAAVNHCDGVFCYPAGIAYGTNKFGVWKERKLTVESYYNEYPEPEGLFPGWVNSMGVDLSINSNGNVFVGYIFGALDTSPVNLPSITSAIRATKIGDCMPVSSVAFENILVSPFDEVTSYLDTAINDAGKVVVAFYDTANSEPHILIESPDIDVVSCAVDANTMSIKIINTTLSPIQLGDVVTTPYMNGIYSTTHDGCTGQPLPGGSSCFIDVNVALPTTIDDLYNVDSTLYLDVAFNDGQAKQSIYVIETDELRPIAVVDTPPVNSTGSGGGAIGLVSILSWFIWMCVSMYCRRLIYNR